MFANVFVFSFGDCLLGVAATVLVFGLIALFGGGLMSESARGKRVLRRISNACLNKRGILCIASAVVIVGIFGGAAIAATKQAEYANYANYVAQVKTDMRLQGLDPETVDSDLARYYKSIVLRTGPGHKCLTGPLEIAKATIPNDSRLIWRPVIMDRTGRPVAIPRAAIDLMGSNCPRK